MRDLLSILAFGFALCLTALPLAAEERMAVYCGPGTDRSQEIAVYSAPGGYVAIEKLPCGQVLTVVSTSQGFSRIITPNNKVGFVAASQLRKVESLEDLKPRVERLEQEVQQLKAAIPGVDSTQRLNRLEQEVSELKSRPASPSVTPQDSSTPEATGRTPAQKSVDARFPSQTPGPATTPHQAVLQTDFPRAELFGGYSYARVEGGTNLHGWNASVAGNITKWLGVVGDVSGQYLSGGDAYTFLGGPQFSFRGTAATGFVRAMVGVTRFGFGVDILGINIGVSDTFLALAAGGGVDVNVSKRLAIRAFQADYVPLRVDGSFIHNFKVGAGVVVKF